jgi:hypothetical protein
VPAVTTWIEADTRPSMRSGVIAWITLVRFTLRIGRSAPRQGLPRQIDIQRKLPRTPECRCQDTGQDDEPCALLTRHPGGHLAGSGSVLRVQEEQGNQCDP